MCHDGMFPTMKAIEKVKNSILGLRHSVERYPLTLILSTVLFILLIYIHELRISNPDSTEDLVRYAMTLGLSLPLTISIAHLNEGVFHKKSAYQAAAFATGAVLLILAYLFLTKDMDLVKGIRYAGTMILFILSVFFTQRIREHRNYETYVIKVFYAIFLTMLYAGVLYFGISAIIFTIDNLFDANIDSKYYYYSFLFVSLIFALSMFLSKLPKIEDIFEDYDYSRALRVLLLYIVIPLITIYTGILYVYFAKIIITQEWPRGLVSNLVLWYSAVSAAVIFFITPVLEDYGVARLFRNFFPKIVLPILAMMFVSIGLRINQYGFTENRYYVVLLGIWVLVAMMYFNLFNKLKNIFLPVSLAVFIIISLYGPLSSFSISDISQNGRFRSILENNGMLVNGTVTASASVPEADRKELSNIIEYFTNRDLDRLRYVEPGFKVSDMEQVFGFPYEPRYGYEGSENFYFYHENQNEPVEVTGYDYYLNTSTYNTPIPDMGDISLSYAKGTGILTFKDATGTLLEVDFNPYLATLKERTESGSFNEKSMLPLDQVTFTEQNEKLRVKFVIYNMNGIMRGDTLEVEGASFLLFLQKVR